MGIGGTIVPYFITEMIAKERVEEIVRGKLKGNMFLVDVTVSPSNSIHVELDDMEGLTIDQCVEVSRHIESSLNRDEEDYSLEVSSPGIDHYFKVNQQFRRNLGRSVQVTTLQGEDWKGKLLEAGENGITMEVEVTEKTENGKKKQKFLKYMQLDYPEIKKAKVIISFK
jgi:ribosome maturation factor RimP